MTLPPLKSVLLVDDNPGDNLIHSIWLERAGAVTSRAHVVVRPNGREALRYLQEGYADPQSAGVHFPPDLILLDINMPIMNGFEFLEALSSMTMEPALNSVVLLMLTSSHAEQDRKRASRFSIVRGYVEKPLTGDGVRQVLETYFSS